MITASIGRLDLSAVKQSILASSNSQAFLGRSARDYNQTQVVSSSPVKRQSYRAKEYQTSFSKSDRKQRQQSFSDELSSSVASPGLGSKRATQRESL